MLIVDDYFKSVIRVIKSLAIVSLVMCLSSGPLYAANEHSDSKSHKSGHSSVSGHSETSDHGDDHGDTHGGSSMEDKVFRGGKAGTSHGGKSLEENVIHGKRGSSVESAEGEEEDSDRPDWAQTPGRDNKPGQGGGKPAEAGSKKGDLYGDLWVVLRDENGVPILTEDGFVQPLDAEGNLIPLNEEGEPIDLNLVVEVELGRLNVGRSPSKVLDKSYDAALTTINSADSITIDEAGRLLLTIDGVEKTIDSPLENLALYITLMNEGYLPGLTLSDAVLGDLVYLKTESLTNSDLLSASSFLAGAADKTSTIALDTVVYYNSIVGVEGSIKDSDGKTYFDYSTFSYDRSATFDGTVTVLQLQPDGSYLPVEVALMDAVFGGETYTDSGLDAFTQATDDALQVIEFVHDNAAE